MSFYLLDWLNVTYLLNDLFLWSFVRCYQNGVSIFITTRFFSLPNLSRWSILRVRGKRKKKELLLISPLHESFWPYERLILSHQTAQWQLTIVSRFFSFSLIFCTSNMALDSTRTLVQCNYSIVISLTTSTRWLYRIGWTWYSVGGTIQLTFCAWKWHSLRVGADFQLIPLLSPVEIRGSKP